MFKVFNGTVDAKKNIYIFKSVLQTSMGCHFILTDVGEHIVEMSQWNEVGCD